MRHGRLWVLFGVLVGLGLAGSGWAQQARGVQWIWSSEGDAARTGSIGTRYFRKTFDIDRPIQKPVDEGTLDITADDGFTVWVNGQKVGEGDRWQKVTRLDVTALLRHGKNVIAVEGRNQSGPAGLFVRLAYVPNGQSRFAQSSDETWKWSAAPAKNWEQIDFDDSAWQSVRVIAPFGHGPWAKLEWDGGGSDRFSVPPGFVVETVVPPRPASLFAADKPRLALNHCSLINLTFDAKGRLLVSQERGPTFLCTDPDASGVFQNIRPYCDQVRSSQGMCWVNGALLLVGDGPQGTGLYRCRDLDGDDRTDEAVLLHKFKGNMGEHGPHAIIHGPDDWLYLVVGNHAWVQTEQLAPNSPLTRWPTGGMGPDQGRIDTTEDVLLPRLNDARGHAANILAPGGTIWRLDHQAKNFSLVACGFRNHYDAAFNRDGELFTFDSDMEWDEGLPWYRDVRICHCPPGADFVWRTGAANTPDYYLDSLPPLAETGRGSPVGVEAYLHSRFPSRYQGACFLADWAIGVIFALIPERQGATWKGKVERFCVGAPMNVTDVAVGPDGGLYFTLGGRGTEGGAFRIVYKGKDAGPSALYPQPYSAWGRAAIQADLDRGGKEALTRAARGEAGAAPALRMQALSTLQNHGLPPDAGLLNHVFRDGDPSLRAHALWLMGINRYADCREAMLAGLKDPDPLVRRRACEALLRAGIEPPVESLWPLLSDPDRFLRTAARLVLERIDPKKWTDRLPAVGTSAALQGIVALCHTNQAEANAGQVFALLGATRPADAQQTLDWLRALQLALIHTRTRPAQARELAAACVSRFPSPDWRVNRELAILLAGFQRERLTDRLVHPLILQALQKAEGDRKQQIHYFYCLRLLRDGWTSEQKDALLAWFESTKTWRGGHSFTPFLENIFKDLSPIFTAEDRTRILARVDELPRAATVLLQTAPDGQTPSPEKLVELYERVGKTSGGEFKEMIVDTLGRGQSREAQAALRRIADQDPARRDAVARSLSRFPSPENWPYLVQGLHSTSGPVLAEVIRGLRRSTLKPKPDEPAPFRALILAASRVDERQRPNVIALLRQWGGGKRFSPDENDWKGELDGWARWFSQTFPAEPELPNLAVLAGQSKWKLDEVLAFLEKTPRGQKGDPQKGKVVFEKANCLKCHKFGKEGEGIGPDLTTLKSRFKRADLLESLLLPSKVISDQYRGTTILTRNDKIISGLAAPQGDAITVLQSDGTKVTLQKSEIEKMVASTVSPMPEKLLDELTLEEIADLFAYLESEPPK